MRWNTFVSPVVIHENQWQPGSDHGMVGTRGLHGQWTWCSAEILELADFKPSMLAAPSHNVMTLFARKTFFFLSKTYIE